MLKGQGRGVVGPAVSSLYDRSGMACPGENRFAGTVWHRWGWGRLAEAPRWLWGLRVGARGGNVPGFGHG